MNRGDLIKTIQIELQNLNREIDLKIIKGLTYRREAKRHKFLLSRLFDLTLPRKSNWMEKISGMAATFIF